MTDIETNVGGIYRAHYDALTDAGWVHLRHDLALAMTKKQVGPDEFARFMEART